MTYCWEIDQLLDVTREWTKSVIGKTHSCTIERSILGMQQMVWELEAKTKTTALELLDKEKFDIISDIDDKEDRKATHRLLESLVEKGSKVTMSELEDFIPKIKEKNVKKKAQLILNKPKVFLALRLHD